MQQAKDRLFSREQKISEEKRATELEAVKLQGLDGLLCSFAQEFSHFFKTRTSNVSEQASQYTKGLIQTYKRRNIERIQEEVPDSDYDNLQHFISSSPWDDQPLLNEVARRADRAIGGSRNTGFIIDPSCFPKRGPKSVGVGRMWCGRLGKKENCQKGIFAALGKGKHACLIDKLLYLTKAWTDDPERCALARIPEDKQIYQSSQELALKLIENADHNGVRYAWIGMDAEFAKPWLLRELCQQGKEFMIDVPSNLSIYTYHPKLHRKPVEPAIGQLRMSAKPLKVRELAKTSEKRWRRLKVRDSSKGHLEVSVKHLHVWWWPKAEEGEQRPEPMRMHLIVRRDASKDGYKYKYSLSNAAPGTTTKRLAYQQAQRFWVEQCIKDCKQDAGMAQYQVRLWRGWHHHVSMSILVGLFMLEMRLKFGDDLPLLSVSDLRELLTSLLPAKNSFKERVEQMNKRHKQREVKRPFAPG